MKKQGPCGSINVSPQRGTFKVRRQWVFWERGSTGHQGQAAACLGLSCTAMCTYSLSTKLAGEKKTHMAEQRHNGPKCHVPKYSAAPGALGKANGAPDENEWHIMVYSPREHTGGEGMSSTNEDRPPKHNAETRAKMPQILWTSKTHIWGN